MSFQDNIGYQVGRTHKALRRGLTVMLRDFDLTPQQFSVLHCLFLEDGLPARELVVRLASDSSTIMDIIDRLEEKSMVQRQDDPQDRRINRIYLTDKTKSILPRILERTTRFWELVSLHLFSRGNAGPAFRVDQALPDRHGQG